MWEAAASVSCDDGGNESWVCSVTEFKDVSMCLKKNTFGV